MSVERKIIKVKSKKALSALLDELLEETILLSLESFSTEELVKELSNRENVRMYAHKFCDEEHITLEILAQTDDESFFDFASER